MSTNIWRPIRGELRRILLSVNGVPQNHISFEGREFNPPTEGIAWLRESIEKGDAETATLGREGYQKERAIYRLDLNWPRKASFADGEDVADAIRCAFRPGRQIWSSGPDWIKGTIDNSQVRTSIPFDTVTQFPIRIGFSFRRKTAQK